MRIKEKSQWRKSAAMGVFSSSLLEAPVDRSLLLNQLKGVCMSLAMIRDQGRTPSFAISCLTDSKDGELFETSSQNSLTGSLTSRRNECHDYDITKA